MNGYVQRAVGIIGLFLLQFSINANSILAQEIKLTASDADSEDLFGFSIDINGDTLVVGAHFDEEYGFQTGSAYVFRRSHGGWFQQTKLGFGSTGALFGRSVAVAGNTIVVGAPYISDPGNPSGISTGGALVYIRESETWSLQARLAASDGVTGDEVGTSVAISADGNTVIVGARQGISDKPGAVYVFIRNGSEWSEQAKLTANDGVIGDRFGRSVAISDNTLAVGALRDPQQEGFVYIFQRSGTTWNEQAKLTASDAASYAFFGQSIGLSGDILVAGAPQSDSEGINDAGGAYIFVRNGTSWVEDVKLVASEPVEFDELGWGVDISADGQTVVIGGARPSGFNVNIGKVYIFKHDGTSWSETMKITPSDGMTGDGFGHAVSISGSSVAVGADGDDDAGSRSGSVYVFEKGGKDDDFPWEIFLPAILSGSKKQ